MKQNRNKFKTRDMKKSCDFKSKCETQMSKWKHYTITITKTILKSLTMTPRSDHPGDHTRRP